MGVVVERRGGEGWEQRCVTVRIGAEKVDGMRACRAAVFMGRKVREGPARGMERRREVIMMKRGLSTVGVEFNDGRKVKQDKGLKQPEY